MNSVLKSLLIGLFGLPRRNIRNGDELEFNCPKCDNGRNKFNLGINTDNHIFHCWSCGYKGKIKSLFYDYGTREQQQEYYSLVSSLPRKSFNGKKNVKVSNKEKISLEAFRSLKIKWNGSIHYRVAMNYLKNRKIDDDIIKKWDICYSEKGKYKNRIIIPSKNINGGVDFFVARSFYDGIKPPYLNPKIDKSTLIFGEKFIDWEKPVIITEGIFDAMALYNSIPILGTNIRHCIRLVKTIIKNKSDVIIAFDSDAINKARKVGLYLNGLGVKIKIVKHTKYNDISETYEKAGKQEVITLLQTAEPFNNLNMAIWELK